MPGAYIFGWDAVNEVWVKCLVNAEGKLIIDPSEIFENTPTDNEHGKAPDSDWAHDHAALSDAHHAQNHSARHENGGADEVSVAGLSGVLADKQDPQAHSARHENGGVDEISVAGLSGDLADAQDPKTHGASHKDGGADEIDAAELAGALGVNGQVLKTNGAACSWGSFSIEQPNLKTGTGSVGVEVAANDYGTTGSIPGGQYGFGFRVKGENNALDFNQLLYSSLPRSYVRPKASFFNNYSYDYIAYLCLRYVTASGEVYWIFLLREQGRIIKAYQAPDHPCFGNGGDPNLVPHPFDNFDPAKQEILVINPDIAFMKEIYDKTPKGNDLLETLFDEYEIDESVRPAWVNKEVTVDLHYNDFPFYKQDQAKVIKRQIPVSDYIKTASFKPRDKNEY